MYGCDGIPQVAASEDALCAAVAIGPVSVAIEADQTAFQVRGPAGTRETFVVDVISYC